MIVQFEFVQYYWIVQSYEIMQYYKKGLCSTSKLCSAVRLCSTKVVTLNGAKIIELKILFHFSRLKW